jgi:hypothetical protein
MVEQPGLRRFGGAALAAPLLAGLVFGRRHRRQQLLQGRQFPLALCRVGDIRHHHRLEAMAGHEGQQAATGHLQRAAGRQQTLGAELRQLYDALAHVHFWVVDLLQDAVFGQEVGEDHLDHVHQLRPDVAGKLGGAEQGVGVAQHLHLLDRVRSAVDEAADQARLGGHVVQGFQHQAGLTL